MTPAEIIALTNQLEWLLTRQHIPKVQVPPGSYFGKMKKEQLLAHANFLCDEVRKYADDSEHWGKANRLFASLQMCLSFAGWYTLQELQMMNRPKPYD